MSNLQSLIEVEPEDWTPLFLSQVLECAIEQNKHGATIVDGFLNSKSRDYQKMGQFIQKDMEGNLIAIGIIKNLLPES